MQPGDFLRPHNDNVQGRRLAFVFLPFAYFGKPIMAACYISLAKEWRVSQKSRHVWRNDA